MSDIRYTFTATGHSAVRKAFESIRNAANSTATAVVSASRKIAAANANAAKAMAAVNKSTQTSQLKLMQTEAAARSAAAVKALTAERRVLRQMLTEYEGVERKKTAVARREGEKRVNAAQRDQRRASRGGGVIGGAGRFAGRVMRTAGSFLAMGAGIAVAGGVGAAVRENVRMEDMARDIAVRGRAPGGRRLDPRAISDEARRTAMATPGVRGVDVLRGTSAFLERTGDLEMAQKSSKVISDIALATGSDVEDVANSAAALFTQFGTGKNNIEDMREQLSLFVIQGKKGAFEMKDMSKGIERLAAAAKVVGVRGDVDQVAVMGGLAQFARRASGSPERATTALEGVFATMQRKRGLIQKRHGIDVQAVAQQDFAAVLPQLFKAIKGDSEKLGKIFEKRSMTGVIDLFNEFQKLAGPTKDYAKATAELTQKIKDMSNAQGAAKDVAMDLADMQQTAGAKLDAAWESIVQAFGSKKGMEAINSLIDAIPAMLPVFKLLADAVTFSATAIRGVVSGIIGLLGQIPGVKDKPWFKDMERGVNDQIAAQSLRESQGQRAVIAQKEEELRKTYGLEPGQQIPEAMGKSHKKKIAGTRASIETAKEMAIQAENAYFGMTGKFPEGSGRVLNKPGLTEAEKALRENVGYDLWKTAKGDKTGLEQSEESKRISDSSMRSYVREHGLIGAATVGAGAMGGIAAGLGFSKLESGPAQTGMAAAAAELAQQVAQMGSGIKTSDLPGATGEAATALRNFAASVNDIKVNPVH